MALQQTPSPLGVADSTFRLCQTVVPVHYAVHWTVQLDEKQLLGNVGLDFDYTVGSASTHLNQTLLSEEHEQIFPQAPEESGIGKDEDDKDMDGNSDDQSSTAATAATMSKNPPSVKDRGGFFIHSCGLTLRNGEEWCPQLSVRPTPKRAASSSSVGSGETEALPAAEGGSEEQQHSASPPHHTIPITAIYNYPKHEAWLVLFETTTTCPAAGSSLSGVLPLTLRLNYIAPITGIDVMKGGAERSAITFCSTVDKEAVVTHLEPTHARKLMPCFDEPCFRATYQVTMTVPKHLSVFTGTLPESERTSDEGDDTNQKEDSPPRSGDVAEDPAHAAASAAVNEMVDAASFGDLSATAGSIVPLPRPTKTVVFEKTPITLPSYLISFVLGNFGFLESETKRGVKCRVIFGQDKNEGDAYFALNLLAQAVEFFEEYFQYPLPLKKIDIVAIDELPILGMENWGLITIMTDYLLVDDKTSVERRRRIARLIGHEVVHHWFGDLVTLEWWRYIWLKEGMARYMEFIFVHHVHPKWHIWLDFLHQVQNETLKADCVQCGPTAHPVETEPLADPRKILDLFDIISYGKAASIIRMVATALGPTQFIASLRNFFKKNALTSVGSEALYQCWATQLQEKPSAGLSDLADRVSGWVTSVGHPYVYAESVDGGMRVHQFKCVSHHEGLVHAVQAANPVLSPRPDSANMSSVLGVPALSPGSVSGVSPTVFRPRSRSRGSTVPVSTHIAIGDHLAPSTLWIPFSVTEIEQGVTSAVNRLDLCTESHTFPCSVTAWFHTHGNGTFRCDYNTASWERIFGIYPYFGGQDRLTIATTIFELRMYHVGLCANDKFDRCLLLLKFISQLVEKKETHNFLWTYMAPKLVEVITLVRHTAAWRTFQPFLQKSLRYLVESGAVSFFANQEADMNNPAEILPATLATLLRINSLVGQPSVVEEAQIYFEWVLSGISEEFPPPEGKERPSDFSKILVSRAEVAFECVAMHGTLCQWVTMCRLFNLLYPKSLQPPALPVQDSSDASPPNTPATAVHGESIADDIAGSSMMGGFGDDELGDDAVTRMQDVSKPITLIPDLTRKMVSKLTTSVICGIVGREGNDELPLQLTTVSFFRLLGTASSSVLSNCKLFSAVLEPAMVPAAQKTLVKMLIGASVGQCSNPIIGQQLSSLRQDALGRIDELANSTNSSSNNTASSIAQQGAESQAKEEFKAFDDALSSVVNQCKWVEYVTDHWNWYLTDVLGDSGVALPADNSNLTSGGGPGTPGSRHQRSTSSASDGSLAT